MPAISQPSASLLHADAVAAAEADQVVADGAVVAADHPDVVGRMGLPVALKLSAAGADDTLFDQSVPVTAPTRMLASPSLFWASPKP